MKDRALYESLQVIRNSDQFSALREWLKDQREKSRDRLEVTDDSYQVEQGKAQMLKKLLDAIETSPEVLNKIVNRN